MKSLISFVKATIVGGILFLVPVIVIAVILGKALRIAIMIAQPMADYVPVDKIVGVAIADFIAVAVIVFVSFVAGLVARSALARGVVEKAEHRFLWKIPGYGFVKGVTDSLGGGDGDTAMRPVLASFDDSTQLAFEVERLPNGEIVVFVPGAPDPWSGAVVIVSADRVQPLSATTLAAVQTFRRFGHGTRDVLINGGSTAIPQH